MGDMAANRLHFRQRRVYKTNVSTREWIVQRDCGEAELKQVLRGAIGTQRAY